MYIYKANIYIYIYEMPKYIYIYTLCRFRSHFGSSISWPQASTCRLRHSRAMNLDPLDSFVERREGRRVIRKILIASNGMAAAKAMHSWRRWTLQEFQSSICEAHHFCGHGHP